MAKDQSGGFHPSKGKPSGVDKPEGLGISNTPPEQIEEYLERTDQYVQDDDTLDPSVPVRHPNRNVSKGDGASTFRVGTGSGTGGANFHGMAGGNPEDKDNIAFRQGAYDICQPVCDGAYFVHCGRYHTGRILRPAFPSFCAEGPAHMGQVRKRYRRTETAWRKAREFKGPARPGGHPNADDRRRGVPAGSAANACPVTTGRRFQILNCSYQRE
jgi:hypothetical protein